MKTCLEDSLESGILSCGDEMWSAKVEGDSNALILPERKKQKNKDKRKGKHLLMARDKKLSKSKIKMQKKLEEDSNKSLLWSKSMEDVEKYKIQDEVYSLMWSSSNIGQVETVRDRRRREVQFSIAGISLPQNNQQLKTGVNPRCEIETDFDINCINAGIPENESMPQVRCDVPESPEPSKELVEKSVLCIDGEAGNVSGVKEVSQKFLHPTDKYDKRSIQDLENEKPTDRGSTGHLVRCTIPRVSTAPLVVHVKRPKEIMDTRKDLPIIMMEQEIMEAINENLSVIICGQTGCGKTTQVPQFLYEAGFGSKESSDRSGIIGITQPRRVAVLATARRVAEELGVKLGKEVGFQVQHNKNISKMCSIKFMTDGILLREVQSDFLLKKYSVLILDEAHERSLNTDILIGMLSGVIRERQKIYEEQQGKEIKPKDKIYPLKLILMSATLQVEDFVSNKRIFRSPPPVVEVPARQYPITTHFSKRTETVDYIGSAYKKVIAIHKKLPPGGILVFVTGVKEVVYLCQHLRKASDEIVTINNRRNIIHESSSVPAEDPMKNVDMEMINDAFGINKDAIEGYDRKKSVDEDGDDDDDDLNDNYEILNDLESSDSELEEIDDENIAEDVNLSSLKAAFEALSGKSSTSSSGPDKKKLVPPIPKVNQFAGPMHVLPLYSMLGPEQQLRVFEKINEKERLVVIATNVAETSLTIPGIKYVVDTGREKVKKYNLSNGMESFEVGWISKASADQRKGRAGRTGPGHCYRLYSSAYFNDKFKEFSTAEILKRPVEDVVLRLRSMGVEVHKFPFPTPPDKDSLVEAERCLKALEALDKNGTLTPLGKTMSDFPMHPRHSRMLLTVIHTLRNNGVYKRANFTLAYAVATASALALPNPFATRFDEISKNADEKDKSRKKKRKEAFKNSRAKFFNPTSDALTVAYTLQCFELSENRSDFCDEYMLHFKTMEEMSKLRKQLLDIVFKQSIKSDNPDVVWGNGNIEDVERSWRVLSEKSPLRLKEEELLCQGICAGWADRVAKRTRKAPGSQSETRVNATCYQACTLKELVFLHRRSSVSKFPPEFLVYSELLNTNRPNNTESSNNTERAYIHWATSVKPEWLVKYGGSLCEFKHLTDPKPYYSPFHDHVLSWVDPTFGPHLWQLPLHSIPIKDNKERVKVFAFCLLEGQVLPSLNSDLKKFMRDQPSCIFRPESLGKKRVGNLLNKLKERSRMIDSRAMLKEVWDESPRELYVEIRDWFQEGYYGQFEELWSKMQKEVKMDPMELFPKKAKRKRG